MLHEKYGSGNASSTRLRSIFCWLVITHKNCIFHILLCVLWCIFDFYLSYHVKHKKVQYVCFIWDITKLSSFVRPLLNFFLDPPLPVHVGGDGGGVSDATDGRGLARGARADEALRHQARAQDQLSSLATCRRKWRCSWRARTPRCLFGLMPHCLFFSCKGCS